MFHRHFQKRFPKCLYLCYIKVLKHLFNNVIITLKNHTNLRNFNVKDCFRNI